MAYMEILVMGLLQEGFRYGHEIDKVVEKRHLRLWTKATRASVYQTLNRLTAKGWVDSRTEKVGKMPERTTYSLTARGEEALAHMIERELASDKLPNFEYAVPVLFMGTIPDDKALDAIGERRRYLRSLLERLPSPDTYERPEEPLRRRALLRFLRAYSALELDWLDWLSEEAQRRADADPDK